MAIPVTIDRAFARVKERPIVTAGEKGPITTVQKVGIDIGLFDVGRFGGTVIMLTLDEATRFALELQGAIAQLEKDE